MNLILINLPRLHKRLITLLVDCVGLATIGFSSLLLRFGEIDLSFIQYIGAVVSLVVVSIPVFYQLGIYRAVVRYIGVRFVFTALISVTVAFLIWGLSLWLLDLPYPRSSLVIAWFMSVTFVAGSRLVMRWLLVSQLSLPENVKTILIYGAGESGRQLFHTMQAVKTRQVVAFIDDDPQLQNHKIGSLKVYAPSRVEKLIERFGVQEILLAIPSLKQKRRVRILQSLEPLPIKVLLLPPISQIVSGEVSFSDIREVDVEDLLGRDPVPPQQDLLDKCIQDRVVLVTGAGGSIGSELCRQVIKLQPNKLLLLEISEYALYQIEQELSKQGVEIIPILGSVQDKKRVSQIIDLYKVNTIYHAAAYKHVPLVEQNIAEGFRNNTLGTLTLAEVAAKKGVENFVLVSTDKAVRPTNFMGASKRMAELALQALQEQHPKTRFVMVRFGNVLGSSGSVIPLFRDQIASGGPVTVTHPEITRFFMTIPEAALLVIQAGSMGVGGDVFVLDMLEPIKILDLATRMIRLSGLEVLDDKGNGSIEIRFTGLRPGEKLFEELLIGGNVDGTAHPRIMKAHEAFVPLHEYKEYVANLMKLLDTNDLVGAKKQVKALVKGFNHTSEIVDVLNTDCEIPVLD